MAVGYYDSPIITPKAHPPIAILPPEDEVPSVKETPFYHKLSTLNDKIALFKDVFYSKQPR